MWLGHPPPSAMEEMERHDDDALTVQLEAAMRASLMHLSASYRDQIQEPQGSTDRCQKAVGEAGICTSTRRGSKSVAKRRKRRLLRKERRMQQNLRRKRRVPQRSLQAVDSLAQRNQETYEGEPGGKAEWFLEEALDTVYDPTALEKR